MTTPTMQQAVRQLIANDAYAMRFQSLGQYRTALLKHVDGLLDVAQPEGKAPQAELRASVRVITSLLKNREWADVPLDDPDAIALFDAVDMLVAVNNEARPSKAHLDNTSDFDADTRAAEGAHGFRAAPGAQHAEGGAQAADADERRSFLLDWYGSAFAGEWPPHFTHAFTGWIASHRAALAAQSQGAQAAIWVQYIDGVKTQNVARDEKEKVNVESIHRLMAPGTTMQWKALYESPEAAQQAAAPGTLDASKGVYWFGCLEKCARLLELADDEPIPSGVVAAVERLIANRDAPGTPEAPSDAGIPASVTTAAARDVLAERQRQRQRQRQVEQEGWTPAHDDKYRENELPRAASAYTLGGRYISPPAIWPWAGSWWKPRDARANYVRAGALLIAEIERRDRAAKPDGGAA